MLASTFSDKNRFKSLLVACLLGLSLPQLSFGQGAPQPTIKLPYGYGTHPYKRTAFHVSRLEHPLDLPYVPGYTGQSSFRAGSNLPSGTKDSCLTMCFNIKESGSGARNWYEHALPAFGWKMDSASGAEVISAEHIQSGNRIQIIFSAPTKEHYKTDMIIKYTLTRS